MAAEVSWSSLVVKVLSGHVEEQPQIHAGNSDNFITKDLLGSLSKAKEIALQLKTQRCSSSTNSTLSASAYSSPDGKNKNQLPNSVLDSKFQNLNFPSINLFEDMASLDLKLQSSTQNHYQSVCTLDKVKYALERAEKEIIRKRSSLPPPPSPLTSLPAATSSSTPGVFAAACPGCLLYVIASKMDPRCPRCNSFVPSTLVVKKPKIDLNASL